MNTEDIKKWMEEKGFDNRALAIDSNQRVSLYLSDVLGEFEESRVKNLTIQRITQQSEHSKLKKELFMLNIKLFALSFGSAIIVLGIICMVVSQFI